MKLNSIERLVVNNPLRRAGQFLEMQWFSRRLPVLQGARILEIGCGRGAGGRLIIEKFSPDLLCLMDLDIQMVSKARNFLSTIKEKHLTIRMIHLLERVSGATGRCYKPLIGADEHAFPGS